MSSNRRLFILIGVILLLVLGLGGFYLWLNGGRAAGGADNLNASTGLIPVKSIYLYGNNKNLQKPVGLGADDQGNFFVTLRDLGRIVEFDRDGNYLRDFGTHGQNSGQLLAPMGVDVDRLADHVYVVDRARLRLICYDGKGTFLWETPILGPLSVTVADNGNVLVTTFGPLVEFTSEGQLIKQVGSRGKQIGQFDFPRAAVTGAGQTIFVADSNNARVQRIEFSGDVTATVDWVKGTPPVTAEDRKNYFGIPSGITMDPQGRVIVLDGFRHIIEMLNPDTNASISKFGGERQGSVDGQFNLPTAIIHLHDDYYAVTDTYNDRVQIIRLLAPGQLNPFSMYPWLKWLFLLLLLPLIPLIGRKRAFVPEETLQRALDEDHGRLLLAVYKKLYVLPEVATKFAETFEGEVKIGEYLQPLVAKEKDAAALEAAAAAAAAAAAESGAAPVPADDLPEEERRLVDFMAPSILQRILFQRNLAICVDEAQCERFDSAGTNVMPYEHVLEDYAIDAEEDGAQPA